MDDFIKWLQVNYGLPVGSYSLLAGLYSESKYVSKENNCYGWIAINKGTANVQVNQVLLFGQIVPNTSGESFSFVDPLGRMYNEDFQITFTTAGTQLLQLVQVLRVVKQ